MKILRKVEIIIFPEFILSFAQYEMKSSDATPFHGSILMRFGLLESQQFPLHASQFAFKNLLRNKDFAKG